jgi:hypothetical protein
MIRPRIAAFLGALALFAPFAQAGEIEIGDHPWRIDVTSTTNGGWRSGTDDYGEIFERLNVATGTGAFQLAFRVDTATFISAPSPPIEDRYTLEKISLSYSGRSLEVTAGDAYLSFGRGLALSLRKLDELGVDTTLRGVKVLLHEGDLGGTLAFGFANLSNLDEASGKSIDDPLDLVGGAEAQVTIADRITVGAHGTIVAFHDAVGLVPNETYRDRYIQLGPKIDAPRLTDDFGLYLEGIAQLRDTDPKPSAPSGFGLYGTATAYLGALTILFEGKAYGELVPVRPNLGVPEFGAISYNNPPTVERIQQILENPQREIAGGRARFDYSFSPELLAYVSYALFRDWQGYDDPVDLGQRRPGTVHDPYAGIELRWNDARSWAIFSGGWRAVRIDRLGEIVRGDLHFDLDVSQALGESFSLTLHAIHQERKKHESPILDQEFREGTILAGFRLRPWLAVTGGFDYTTEPTQPKSGYPNGTVQWDITPSSSVRLFAGSARGGLKCVSGVCRTFPPFEGVKATVTIRL